MAIFYRAHKKDSIPYVFSGDGGLYTSGRWNHKGRKIVYCSESLALATMEWLAHNGHSVSGFNYHKFSIDIPDEDIIQYKLSSLPLGWDVEPATNVSKDFSDQHLFSVDGPLAIEVPSVMIPEEFNLLINPLHKNFISVLSNVKYLGQFQAPRRF